MQAARVLLAASLYLVSRTFAELLRYTQHLSDSATIFSSRRRAVIQLPTARILFVMSLVFIIVVLMFSKGVQPKAGTTSLRNRSKRTTAPTLRLARVSIPTPNLIPPRSDDSACLFRRTNSSRLNGKFADVAKSSAPPADEKTDKSRGAFTPKAIVIVSAKVVRRTPLNKAMVRVFQPRTSRSPKRLSAAVAIIANAGIVAAGKNQFSLAV